MLIEVHLLQNHVPSNLNRDDTGSPKDCIFGGVRRARISSQCQKRSARTSEIFQHRLEGKELGTRTRRLPQLVKEYLIEKGVSEELAQIAGEKASGIPNKDGKETKDLKTAQTIFLSAMDVQTIAEIMLETVQKNPDPKDLKKINTKDLINQHKALRNWRAISPDIALFGRMTTSDIFLDIEASMQVAHAISVNKMDQEFDYYTAVDDLQKSHSDEETGADMIGDIEFSSACYYKYFSLDVDGLVQNLSVPKPKGKEETPEAIPMWKESVKESKEAARVIVRAILEAFALTNPSGKQNSFAAHQIPDAILVEVRPIKMPISYANAFVKPVTPSRDKDLTLSAIHRLTDYAQRIHHKYTLEAEPRLWFCTYDEPIPHINEMKVCQQFSELLDAVDQAILSKG